MAQGVIRGRLTRCDLSSTRDLFHPWRTDVWGYARPAYSRAAARLSAELSGDIYDLDIGRWLDAGWDDCTLQMENRVFGGLGGWRHGGLHPDRVLHNGLSLAQARAMLSPLGSPVRDLLRVVRRVHTEDNGKALVMARQDQATGRIVLAICFMGTSRKYYDWLTNFTLSREQGLHSGFLRLARQFNGNADHIVFPLAAKTLGIEGPLTLEDILEEARREDSRFLLWLTGHSQGGAACQTYAHMLLHQRGVHPLNLIAYTFAAPTVAGEGFERDPASYPLYNLINGDDYVPRVGASVRLGMDMWYYPDDTFRARHYGYDVQDAQRVAERERLQALMYTVQGTADSLESTLALCTALAAMDDEGVTRDVLSSLHVMLRLLAPAMQTLGIPVRDVNRMLARQIRKAYRDATGQNPDEERVRLRGDAILYTLRDMGAKAFTRCLLEVLFAPHNIAGAYDDTGALRSPYCAIACEPERGLVPRIWRTGDRGAILMEAPENL